MTAPASITDYLTTDHRAIDDQLASALDSVKRGDLAGARAPLDRFRARLERHIKLEEEVVFPLFVSRTGIAGPPQMMRREHRMLEAHLRELACALDAGDAGRLLEASAPLEALIAEHNLKEERILYPKTDQALGEERAHLAAELARA